TGKYNYHQMNSRVGERALPQIQVVSLRNPTQQKRNPFWLSAELHHAMTETLSRGEQVALFLNRRGMAQTVLCEDCGHVYRCPNCSIALTLHGKKNLVCHYCDFADVLAEHCPECNSSEVRPVGIG